MFACECTNQRRLAPALFYEVDDLGHHIVSGAEKHPVQAHMQRAVLDAYGDQASARVGERKRERTLEAMLKCAMERGLVVAERESELRVHYILYN